MEKDKATLFVFLLFVFLLFVVIAILVVASNTTLSGSELSGLALRCCPRGHRLPTALPVSALASYPCWRPSIGDLRPPI